MKKQRKKNRNPKFICTHQAFTLPVAVYAVLKKHKKASTALTNLLLTDVPFCSAVADKINLTAIVDGEVGRVAHVTYNGVATILIDGQIVTVKKGGWQLVEGNGNDPI